MHPIYVNLFGDGALVEDIPAGTTAMEVRLGEREARCLAALLALGSYEVSAALGALFFAGVQEAQRSDRRPVNATEQGGGGPCLGTITE
jgi:hypothetical protein